MKCEACEKREIEIKDFRETDFGMEKFFVCLRCSNLRDESFFRKIKKGEMIKERINK